MSPPALLNMFATTVIRRRNIGAPPMLRRAVWNTAREQQRFVIGKVRLWHAVYYYLAKRELRAL